MRYSDETISRCLALIRDGMSITEAARTVGVSRPTVYKWLRGAPSKKGAVSKRAQAAREAATKRRAKRKQVILDAVAAGMSLTQAAERAGVHRMTVTKWRDKDPEFDAAYDVALEQGADRLEDRVLEISRSDTPQALTACIFLLKARRPEKYRDRYHIEHAGSISAQEIRAAEERLEQLLGVAAPASTVAGDGSTVTRH